MSTMKTAWIALAGVAAGLLFAAIVVTGDGRVVPLALVLCVGGYLLVSRFLKASRRRAVEREARRLGLSFSRRDPFRVLDSDFHPFLRYGKWPGTQGVENVVWGVRDGREVRAFEYWRPAQDEWVRYSCAMVRIDGRTVRATAGTLVVAPRGAVHAFPVAIDSRARFLNIHTPNLDFDGYLRKLNEMRARGEKPDDEFLKAYDSYNV